MAERLYSALSELILAKAEIDALKRRIERLESINAELRQALGRQEL